jgi:hypothetical protein
MAFSAAVASFALAAVMLVLVVLDYLHLRRVSLAERALIHPQAGDPDPGGRACPGPRCRSGPTTTGARASRLRGGRGPRAALTSPFKLTR